MAKVSPGRNTFLGSEALQELRNQFQFQGAAPDGDVRKTVIWTSQQVSDVLSSQLLTKLEKIPSWRVSVPILVGSWGRGELCPKSDLDILFIGPEVEVQKTVKEMELQGLRVRYRIPVDLENWSVGVESADILSLWGARALTKVGQACLENQQKKLFGDRLLKKKILRDIILERKVRAKRYDSISNFLEPNLKYGPGGLRDAYQGLVIRDLFGEKFENPGYESLVLNYYQHFFLMLRQRLHLSGFSDVLVSSEQAELGRDLDFKTNADFMREIQRGISRVHFYSEWILERAKSSEKRQRQLTSQSLKKPEQLLAALKKDASVLSQYQVRLRLDTVFPKKAGRELVPARLRGHLLWQVLKPAASEVWLQTTFRSRLIDKLCPRMHRLVGYVQHDQYHRFTADAHILQACREVKRIHHKPTLLGPLNKVARELKTLDWTILAWTALYHDLAKGIPGSDHSTLGAKWVAEDLRAFGVSANVIKEVQWMVKNHLELSLASFRKNPQDPKTWEHLQSLGLTEARLLRLAVFTAVDIRATNPEAWNDWKAKLLANLVQKVRSGGTQTFFQVKKSLKKRGLQEDLWTRIDPQLFDVIPAAVLTKDLQMVLQKKLGWKVYRDRQNKIWIRYFQHQDQAGLLSQLVEKITGLGCSIQHALIHTVPNFGVYDWFQIQSNRDISRLQLWLGAKEVGPATRTKNKAEFMSIKMISQSPEEWILSFRGVDQKGLLLAATQKLKLAGADILSARVHTWGRQVEDLFHIAPMKITPEELLTRIRGA